MKLFGITGGIGMGKSTAGNLLKARALPVLDTDDVARQVVEPGQPALIEILEAFGPDVIDREGRLRRDEMAKRVFSDPEARRKLESILHPRIRQSWLNQAEQWRANGCSLGFVIIPLLFETNASSHFAATICVACTERSQTERLKGRSLTINAIRQRVRSQWPIQRKMEASDFVVWTDTSLEMHQAQWDVLLADFLR